MAAIIKTKLKAAKDAVGKKDYEKARDASLAALDYDSENYHAYVAISACTAACAKNEHQERLSRRVVSQSG